MALAMESRTGPRRPFGDYREAARIASGSCSSWARNPARPTGCLATQPPSSESRRQENLWRHFFQDPTLWWDNRQQNNARRWPDFRHRRSHEVLWLNNSSKPAWVDAQLAALDADMHMQMGMSRFATTHRDLPDFPDPRRPAGDDGSVTAEIVSKLCYGGRLTQAVEALELLVQAERSISRSLFFTVLKACVVKKDLVLGRRVHGLTLKKGYRSDTFLGNHLLRMYASHGRLQDAMDVFEAVSQPDAFMWSSIISAHVKHGQDKQAIQLYHRMRRSSVKPDGHVFVAALQACARGLDLKSGQQGMLSRAWGGKPSVFTARCKKKGGLCPIL